MTTEITIKFLREGMTTGIRTWAIISGEHELDEFIKENINPAGLCATARGYRVNAAGLVTFKSGGGYDFIDMDLLDGIGDGRMADKLYPAGLRITIK